MKPEEVIQFRNEQNLADDNIELVARILFELRGLTNDSNEIGVQNISQRTKEYQGLRQDNFKASQERGELVELSKALIQTVQGKNVDLSEVINGLSELKNELSAMRQDELEKELSEDQKEERKEEKKEEKHQAVIALLSDILSTTKENKPEKVELKEVVDAQKEGDKKTHELLSALLAEMALIEKESPEIEIPEFPKEIEIKEPKWYKPFEWNGLDWKPMEKLLAPVKDILQKILDKKPQEIPVKEGRVLVSVDRTGGSGGGVINTDGTPINPATEENQDPTAGYSISDKDESGTTKYYGYLNGTGGWYIMEVTSTTIRYVKGDSGYNFSNRASETYDTFDAIF